MRSLLAAALYFSLAEAFACSIHTGVEQFTANLVEFERKRQGRSIATLPAPRVGEIRVKRGTAAAGSSCEDAGQLVVHLMWPAESAYGLDEIGFYFRVTSGDQPDMIFPLYPVVGMHFGSFAKFAFVWLDGAPSEQEALDLEVEVFAVNYGLEIGKAAHFKVSADGG